MERDVGHELVAAHEELRAAARAVDEAAGACPPDGRSVSAELYRALERLRLAEERYVELRPYPSEQAPGW